MDSFEATVIFGNLTATKLLRVSQNPKDLKSGWWAVLQTFEGDFFAFEFERPSDSTGMSSDLSQAQVHEFPVEQWTSNISQSEYESGVETVRESIAAGWVYQTNYCRILSQPLAKPFSSLHAYQKILQGNPAPYACAFSISKDVSGLDFDVRVASASPELFLKRDGDMLMSSPIKGTASSADEMLEKDSAENVMIVDLIRNDLSHVCSPGTVKVPDMLRVEEHPGLVHLVSDVSGQLTNDSDWNEILQAMCPPGSVSGAPKSSSLKLISKIEPQPREVYCGFLGWIDVDNSTAQLAVGIRTFWQSFHQDEPTLCFGTGAGITYASDPTGEWKETELKAKHLLAVLANTDH